MEPVVTTKKFPGVEPDMSNNCQAIVTTQVVICEPMTNGQWRLVKSFQDNYNVVLENRPIDDAVQELVDGMKENKQRWQRIIKI